MLTKYCSNMFIKTLVLGVGFWFSQVREGNEEGPSRRLFVMIHAPQS